MIRVKTEESHYTIKLVDKLPKKGNANWLYAIKNEPIKKGYVWTLENEYRTIYIGSSEETEELTFLQAGTNVTVTGEGTMSDPFIVSSIKFTPTNLLVDYGVTLATVATTNNYNDLDNLPTEINILDTAYGIDWNGDTVNGASRNTIYDKIESLPKPALEAIDEGNGIGWVISERDSANYGNVGLGAVDLSYSNGISTTRGATGTEAFAVGGGTTASGFNSFAAGFSSEASGDFSVALGSTCIASGDYSFSTGNSADATGTYAVAFGNNSQASGLSSFSAGGNASGDRTFAVGITTEAHSYGEAVFGILPTTYTPSSTNSFIATDRLINVGAGTAFGTRIDAFTILKNGKVGVGINNLETTTSEALLNVNGATQTKGYTVATLPVGSQGMRAYVTDANATTFLSTVVGGGFNVVPVFHNGTNWVIA